MRPGDLDAGGVGQPVQAASGGVAIHPGAAGVEQVFLAEVGDVRAGGFEDPQAEQAGHGHQGEVVRVRRIPGPR